MLKMTPEQRQWLRPLLNEGLGLSFWMFLALASGLGLVVYFFRGAEAFDQSWGGSLNTTLDMLPRVGAALVIAGMVWVLMPREALSRFVGRDSGLRGLVVATIAGIITLGGPSSAFPLLAVLAAAGADRGIMIAYITSWATLGIQRTLMWDLPLMGPDFTLTRLAVSLPLPILAGQIARWLPIEMTLKTDLQPTYPPDPDEGDPTDDERGRS